MECIDTTLSIIALISITLIIAGTHLMMIVNNISRSIGVFSFAFGYILLGLLASGGEGVDLRNRRTMLGLSSVIAIVVGTLLTYYHIEQYIQQNISVFGDNTMTQDISGAIPIFDQLLIVVGFGGLALTISVDDDFEFNYTKMALAIIALFAIGYTKRLMIMALAQGQDAWKKQVAHIASWGLMILATSYVC